MPSAWPSPAVAPPSHNSEPESSPWLNNPRFEQCVERVLAEENVTFGAKGRYTPLVVLAAWMRQVLHNEPCRTTLMWLVLTFESFKGVKSFDTGRYCRVRAQLPEVVLRRLVAETARDGEAAAADAYWNGRSVFLADGATVTMPDTPQSQAVYPQPKAQKPGVGLPIVRMVALFSLATGMVYDAAFGPCQGKQTGETALLRKILGSIPPGSILVADRYYCSYWMIAQLRRAGVDVVFRMHQLRKCDFRQGRKLGRDDCQLVWRRPVRPTWMTAEEYATIPETLSVRMIRTTVQRRGCRVKDLTVATTLNAVDAVDVDACTAAEILGLYKCRWNAELDIRSLKSIMKMEMLRCKTPENVRREICIHLLVYNLSREYGLRAARNQSCTPREISFKACEELLRLESTQPPGFLRGRVRLNVEAPSSLLLALGKERVGDRPDRTEPRAVKRRPKPHKLLNEPRAVARARLLDAAGV